MFENTTTGTCAADREDFSSNNGFDIGLILETRQRTGPSNGTTKPKESQQDANSKILEKKIEHLYLVETHLCRSSGIYRQLPLRWTRSGPAPTVRLIEVSTLEGDELND